VYAESLSDPFTDLSSFSVSVTFWAEPIVAPASGSVTVTSLNGLIGVVSGVVKPVAAEAFSVGLVSIARVVTTVFWSLVVPPWPSSTRIVKVVLSVVPGSRR
jgi:hypothetical protein